jgi:hypothetical protein
VRKADSRILRSVRQARSYARGEITDIEYVVNEAIEAASRYVSLLPAGQRVWGEREYDVADIAPERLSPASAIQMGTGVPSLGHRGKVRTDSVQDVI